MARRGPKPLEISWEQFDKLCLLQCSQKEIGWWFDVSVDTLERRCKRDKKCSLAEYYAKKKGLGRISLRKAQWQVAVEKNNVPMLIFLGKNYLGQSDKINFPEEDPSGFEFVTSRKENAGD